MGLLRSNQERTPPLKELCPLPGDPRQATEVVLFDIYSDAGELDEGKIDSSILDEDRPVWIGGFDFKIGIALDVLSVDLVSYIANSESDSEVESWLAGDDVPTVYQAQRICIASTVVRRFAAQCPDAVVIGRESPDMRSWFLGANPTLSEVSPAEFIRESEFRVAAAGIAAATVGTFM